MASNDTVQEALDKAQELFEEQRRQDEVRFEEEQRRLAEDAQNAPSSGNEDTGTTDSGNGNAGDDARGHRNEEPEAAADPAQMTAGTTNEPLDILADTLPSDTAEPEDSEHGHGDHLDHADIFNAAATNQSANDYKWIKKEMVEQSGGDTSFKTSFDRREKESEAKRDSKNFQSYMTLRALTDYEQRAIRITDEMIDDMNKELARLAEEDQALADRQRELEKEQEDLGKGIEAQEAAVTTAEADAAEAEIKLDQAAQDVAVAQENFYEADSNYSLMVQNYNDTLGQASGVYDNKSDTLFLKDQDGSWKAFERTEDGSFAEEGRDATEIETNRIEAPVESVSGRPVNSGLNRVVVNEDGTIMLRQDNGRLVEADEATQEAFRQFNEQNESSGLTVNDLNSGSNEALEAADSWSSAFGDLTTVEEAYDIAEGTLNDELKTLEEKRAHLDDLQEQFAGNEEELEKIADKRAEIALETEKIQNEKAEMEEFQERIGNREFGSEQEMIDAMPEQLNVTYTDITSPAHSNDYNQDVLGDPSEQMYASTSQAAETSRTATSYASEFDNSPNELSSQAAFAAVANPNQPAPGAEPTPQDPAADPVYKHQQPQQFGIV